MPPPTTTQSCKRFLVPASTGVLASPKRLQSYEPQSYRGVGVPPRSESCRHALELLQLSAVGCSGHHIGVIRRSERAERVNWAALARLVRSISRFGNPADAVVGEDFDLNLAHRLGSNGSGCSTTRSCMLSRRSERRPRHRTACASNSSRACVLDLTPSDRNANWQSARPTTGVVSILATEQRTAEGEEHEYGHLGLRRQRAVAAGTRSERHSSRTRFGQSSWSPA